MHFIRSILIIGIACVPLIYSNKVSLGDGFFIPTLKDIESHVETLWTNFKKGYGIMYNTTTEEVERFKIFADHVKMIIKHNFEHDLGIHTYRLGINEYTAMTNQEFRQKFNGFRRTKDSRMLHSEIRRPLMPASPYTGLPTSIDWRTFGLVTPVKDQGQCGSCWAFSATGALEAQHARATGKLVSLSEQQLVDCSTKWGNYGCDGGLPDNAFKYVYDNKGLDDERTYPYRANNGASCKFRPQYTSTTCDGFVDIPEGNETALQEAVALYGPVAVAIDASLHSFQFYTSGVYSDVKCSSENLDHAVLVVGYGVDSNPIKGKQEYYIVKNSWSANWGDEGYIKMARNKRNMCGISTAASFPIVKDKLIKQTMMDD